MRARNIKPGYFRNEELAELQPLTRLLFSGLWCVADREGRLEDRPKRIKADVLPYDDCDVDAMLTELADAGFVRRYQVAEIRYVCVVNFCKHQTPHKNEAESQIPAPEDSRTSTVQAPESHNTNPSDSLIPDTLNSDSLIPDTETESSRAVRAASPDSPYAVFRVFLETLQTEDASVSPAWKNKQLGIAKRLIEQGYGEDKVLRCVTFMRSQSWRTDPFDLGGVEKYIGTWEANGEPEYEQAKHRPGESRRTTGSGGAGSNGRDADVERRGYDYDEVIPIRAVGR